MFLDPNRRPLAAGLYESSLVAQDGATVVYSLLVRIANRRATYEIFLADGTLADALDRHFLRESGRNGWWSLAEETGWGTRADTAYARWLEHVQSKLAAHGYPPDRWRLPPPPGPGSDI